MSDPRLDAIRGIQRRADDVRDRSYAAAEWCDVRFLLAELERVTAALRDLHAEVEMAESVGICLPDRVPSLRAGDVLSGGARAAQEDA
jgi:hypothetical protein